jgi:hypothetical protein
MQDKEYQDELARRRAARTESGENSEQNDEDDEDDMPQLTWKDTLAMIIAAYQVLFPVVFALIGVLLFVWLLFAYVFS